MRLASLSIVLAVACAHTDPREVAILQKTTVDGIGGAYLEYCEIAVRPRCIEEDRQAKESGNPQTRDQRIACLRPCDSASAEMIQERVDDVRTSQTALFLMIKADPSAEDLAASREQLTRSVQALSDLLRRLGVFERLTEAFGP